MPQVPIGMIILVILSVIIYFGLAQRVLDRMKLTDRGALAFIAAIIIGSFIEIPIVTGRTAMSVNLGGALIPLIFVLYLLFTAGTAKEWGRTVAGTVVATFLLVTVNRFISADPETMMIDPLWVTPIIAGVTAYVISHSRRGAFITAVLSVILADVVNYFWLLRTGTPGRVAFGGAGALDAVILSGIIAVLLAEFIGELRERLQGGPALAGRPKKLLEGLKNPSHSLDGKGEETNQKESKEGGDGNEK
ncbi:DUF1614 domain-containing protein [Dehalobacterium formicoaceticum]|uniref:DUF1614 domain-containing protein n=1 Tax=Dehalobacterium formicoaceticum TaxID=51515 RepID=A0ABT1Y6Z8_9FIRM|nr:DUF1614 domain-containing protein [Dehalobacterium formicoaceticum]MCR6545875.1 DUF1614 domain-containing protein [Dehalobacterium formicoaceticum]